MVLRLRLAHLHPCLSISFCLRKVFQDIPFQSLRSRGIIVSSSDENEFTSTAGKEVYFLFWTLLHASWTARFVLTSHFLTSRLYLSNALDRATKFATVVLFLQNQMHLLWMVKFSQQLEMNSCTEMGLSANLANNTSNQRLWFAQEGNVPIESRWNLSGMLSFKSVIYI